MQNAITGNTMQTRQGVYHDTKISIFMTLAVSGELDLNSSHFN